MINIGIQKSKNRETVNISGSLTVEHAAEVKKAIQSALEKRSKNIVLSLGTITKADLTFFQVVCSAHRTAMKSEKTFSVEQFQQDILIHAHRSMGFARRIGCALDKTKSCVFMLMSA
jgi:anti-anti-sigma regulatory factor